MKTILRLFSGLLTLFTIASVAKAEPKRINHQIDGNAGYLTFASMLKQAEAIAQETAERSFQQPDTTEIVINVSADQSGQIMPILILRVTRANWQQQPNVSTWAKYSGGVKQLLGFDRSIPRPSSVPTIATTFNPIRDGLTEREANFYNQP